MSNGERRHEMEEELTQIPEPAGPPQISSGLVIAACLVVAALSLPFVLDAIVPTHGATRSAGLEIEEREREIEETIEKEESELMQERSSDDSR